MLDIGGSHVTAALADAERTRVRDRIRRPLDPHGTAEEILAAVLRCAAALPAAPGAVWGIAVPGPFDYERGIARYEGVGKFDSLHGVDIRAALLDGLPHRPGDTVFLNDAHAFLIGEWRAGAARGHRRAAGLTLGTGVGSAFLADGELIQEGSGLPPQGRVDLLRLDGRPLEDSVSRRAIRARYGDPDADVREIAARARAGEPRAREVTDTAFTALGRVLAAPLTSFGATALVVGGSMAASWDLVGPALRAGLGHTPVTVHAAALAEDASLLGAAHAAGRGRPPCSDSRTRGTPPPCPTPVDPEPGSPPSGTSPSGPVSAP